MTRSAMTSPPTDQKTRPEQKLAAPLAHQAEHVLPIQTYLAVYGGLLLLTGLTVLVSLLSLGELAIYIAMAVAVTKAALVVGYFMHLKFDTRFNSLVFLSSLLFLVVFFLLTMIDLRSRGDVQELEGNFELRDMKAIQQKAQEQLRR